MKTKKKDYKRRATMESYDESNVIRSRVSSKPNEKSRSTYSHQDRSEHAGHNGGIELKTLPTKYQNLPIAESSFYLAVSVFVLLFAVKSIYSYSQDVEYLLVESHFLSPGWSFLNHFKDTRNYEWTMWQACFSYILPLTCLHVIAGQIARHIHPQERHLVFGAVGVLGMGYTLGLLPSGVIMGQALSVYLICSYIPSLWTLWVLVLMNIYFFHTTYFRDFLFDLCRTDEPYPSRYLLMVFTYATLILRSVSFCSDMIGDAKSNVRYDYWTLRNKMQKPSKERKGKGLSEGIQTNGVLEESSKKTAEDAHEFMYMQYEFTDFLSYCFYIPLVYYGPILTYSNYRKQINRAVPRLSRQHIFQTTFEVLRAIFWFFVVEVMTHFLYFESLMRHSTSLAFMSPWCLASCCYVAGHFFILKYTVFWGVSKALTGLDDIELPNMPMCPSTVYSYTTMWKHIDHGLHKFLTRHIYFPLGGPTSQLGWRAFSQLLAFAFSGFWHGADLQFVYWAVLSFMSISIEAMAGHYLQKLETRNWVNQRFGARMQRRLLAALYTPLWVASTIIAFIFIGSPRIASNLFTRLIIEGFPTVPIVIHFVMYCNVQTAFEIEKRKHLKQQMMKNE